jgi:hypothetical protein
MFLRVIVVFFSHEVWVITNQKDAMQQNGGGGGAGYFCMLLDLVQSAYWYRAILASFARFTLQPSEVAQVRLALIFLK